MGILTTLPRNLTPFNKFIIKVKAVGKMKGKRRNLWNLTISGNLEQ
jgi:hypothetical protein